MAAIRVCQLITELAPAGAERMVYELATRLDRQRFYVEVVGLRGGAVADMLAAKGVPVHVLGVRGKWDVFAARRLAKLLKPGGFDILHTHLFHADLAGRLALRRAGIEHLIHTVHASEQRWRPWQYAFARWTAKRCDRIICVSQSAMEHHAARTHLPRSHYTVIPNGVDLDSYAISSTLRTETRHKWGVREGQAVVLFAGRLDASKGLELLLPVASQLVRGDTLAGRSRLHFVFAGDGPMRPQVEDFAASHVGHATVLGHVTAMRPVYCAADMLVLPSLGEGFGLVLAEAMAAELACIGTDVAGIKDVIIPEQTGLLAPPQDPAALAAAILRLADHPDLRRRLAQAGRARVAEHFTIQANVKAHEDLYGQLLAART